MQYDLITIFPDIFDSYINKGMLRVAQEKKKIEFKIHNLRDFATDKHGTVDDRPFGGGPGQVFMVEPIVKAIKKSTLRQAQGEENQKINPSASSGRGKSKVILLSAKGKKWNQQMAKRYSKLDQLVFVCPRYEGVDERVKKFVDEEISIGDYILTGGELGALVIIDSVTRLIPGVLGKQDSLAEESHSKPGYLEYPQYTRPEVFEHQGKKYRVPKVLLSGHHGKIKEWREKHSKSTSTEL
jgi:tRNA (guanine37-N1)-methyltransferase